LSYLNYRSLKFLLQTRKQAKRNYRDYQVIFFKQNIRKYPPAIFYERITQFVFKLIHTGNEISYSYFIHFILVTFQKT
jgi:hypothetical protein